MRKALFFFLAVAVLLVIACFGTSSRNNNMPKEHFQNLMGVEWTSMNDGTPKALYTDLPIKLPTSVVSVAEAGVGNIQPSPPPKSDLPSAPMEQRPNETPSPYINPVTQPAKYIQILGVKEDLQAFFGFQAFVLEERADPAVQLPLTRARGDMGELIDVQSVMERNPGLPSRISNKQLDDIRSNLRYLRDTLHDLEASGAVKPEALEAFEDVTSGSHTSPNGPEDGQRATMKELEDFLLKVQVEITRLGASGTSDPVLEARINTLNMIKNDVEDVISELNTGAITPDTVPIFSSDLKKAFPLLGNPTDPLPDILKKNNLPPAVANLFPGGLSPKDNEQATQINNIVKGYMNNLFEGASWGVNLMFNYENPNTLKLKQKTAEAQLMIANASNQVTGLPGVNKVNPSVAPYDSSAQSASSTNAMNLGTDATYSPGLPGISPSSARIVPELPPAHLDWKERAQQIKKQVTKRGLEPTDFGMLPENSDVSKEFSWRGYTQMLCSRVNNATMDPGLGITVGCPPPNWPGWIQ